MKQLSGINERRLSAYSTAAAALIGIPLQADAFIVYQDIDPDLVVLSNDTLFLDIDGDGIDDIQFWIESQAGVITSASGGVFSYTYRFAYASALNANRIFGMPATSEGFSFNSAYNFTSGDLIGGSTLPLFANKARLSSHVVLNSIPFYSGGPWNGVDNGLMGVRFNIDGNQHFAWIRLSVAATGSSMTISELAWDNQTDVGGITAGLTASIAGIDGSAPNIWGVGNTVIIEDISPSAIVQLFNIQGQAIPFERQDGARIQLQVAAAEPGNYIVRIQEDGAVYTKQLFLTSM
jgi:hypothetical protein